MAEWLLNVVVEFGFKVPGCNGAMGYATTEVSFAYGPYQPRDAMPTVQSSDLLEWVLAP